MIRYIESVDRQFKSGINVDSVATSSGSKTANFTGWTHPDQHIVPGINLDSCIPQPGTKTTCFTRWTHADLHIYPGMNLDDLNLRRFTFSGNEL